MTTFPDGVKTARIQRGRDDRVSVRDLEHRWVCPEGTEVMVRLKVVRGHVLPPGQSPPPCPSYGLWRRDVTRFCSVDSRGSRMV